MQRDNRDMLEEHSQALGPSGPLVKLTATAVSAFHEIFFSTREPGKGTTFVVELPIAESRDAEHE